MSTIGYGYGSEWHMLRWLGYHRAELSAEVERAIGSVTAAAAFSSETLSTKTLPDVLQHQSRIEWLDFPWSNKPSHLHSDTEWEGIGFVKHSVLSDDIKVTVAQAWKEFWPSSGTAQCWDAVGVRQTVDGPEWLLTEAKAHLSELKGNGCGASQESQQKIRAAFVLTQQSLCIHSATGTAANDKLMSNWLGKHYQYANRLAALYFFTEYLPQYHNVTLPMRLINIYFLKADHTGHARWKNPQTEQEWSADIDTVYAELGLTMQGAVMRHLAQKPALLSHVHELYLPVLKP